MFNTPIVLLIFNRPDLTTKVFELVRQVKPKTLLVVADGPRVGKEGELEKCQQTRIFTETIDWDCEVFRNYSEINLGCGLRVSSGLNWVFEQFDRAIILEDDCLPHIDFFRFCDELLEKYYDNEQITMISGFNSLPELSPQSSSYYFSCFSSIWGWATWRRAWKLYDYDMKLFPSFSKLNYLDYIFSNKEHQKYWHEIFNQIFQSEKKITWDYQWLYAQWIHGGLGIVSNVNLISNIGFRLDATHTKGQSNLANVPTMNLDFPLKHPATLLRNLQIDDLTQRKLYMKVLSFQLLKKLISFLKLSKQ
jgi:hypothetical protein